MGRVQLPEARVEPRGLGGRLAQLEAQARQHGRTARAIGVVVVQVIGWTAFVAATVALLAWLAPPPRSAQLDDLRRLQEDFARSQVQMDMARRAMEQLQVEQLRLERFQVNPRLDLEPPPPPPQ